MLSSIKNRLWGKTSWVSWAIIITVAMVGCCILTVLLVQSNYQQSAESILVEAPDVFFLHAWSTPFQLEDVTLLKETVGGVRDACLVRPWTGQGPGHYRDELLAPRREFQSVQPEYFRVRGLLLEQGRSFDRMDDGKKVAVIGKAIADFYGLSPGSIFRDLMLAEQYKVVGVLKEVANEPGIEEELRSEVADWSVNTKVFLPFNPVFKIRNAHPTEMERHPIRQERNVQLWASVKEGWNLTDVAEAARALFEKEKGDKVFVEQGKPLKITYTQVVEQTTGSLDLIATLVVVVGLLNVSGLIVMNTFINAKEVGIKRACGANKSQIVSDYLRRYFSLSLIGTAIAVALAYYIAPAVARYQGASVDWSASKLSLGILLTVAIGPLCSILPARLASSISPVDSIRDRAAWGRGRRRIDLRQLLISLAFGSAIAVIFFTSFYGYSSVVHTDSYLRSVGRDLVTIEEPQLPTTRLSQQDYQALQAAAESRNAQVAWLAHTRAVASRGEEMLRATLCGVAGDILTVRGFQLAEGSWLMGERQAVIGSQVAKQLFGQKNPVGQTIVLGNNLVEFTVAGVLAPRPQGVTDFDNDRNHSIFIDLKALPSVGSDKPTNAIYWLADKQDEVAEDMEQIADALQQSNARPEDLAVTRPVGELLEVKELLVTFHLSVVLLSIIAVATACIGVSALTLVQTKEMEREIAIQRACGASKRIVFRSSLKRVIGVVLLAATGGLILGYVLYTTTAALKGYPLVNTWLSITTGLIVSVVLAVISAYIPAKHAAEKPPASIF